ncbi:hypothetical protein [Sorangium sp. So ce131]|uniref:hypothetical protein n=1 Tax=Sorangium sp. So ce131 TaxID=3133282 RepID=UPI003F637F6F
MALESTPGKADDVVEREMRRQGAKDAKGAKKKTMPWRLDGSKFCSFQAASTRFRVLAPA